MDGKRLKEIAGELGISISNVRRRMESLRRKFSAGSSIQLAIALARWKDGTIGEKATGAKAKATGARGRR